MELMTEVRGRPVRRLRKCILASSPARAGSTVEEAKPTVIAWKAVERVAAADNGRIRARHRAAWNPTASRFRTAAAAIQRGWAVVMACQTLAQETSWNVHVTPTRRARAAVTRIVHVRVTWTFHDVSWA